MTKTEEINEYMANCNGFENHYRHPLFSGRSYSDGVKFVADKAGAYWLLDAIFSYSAAGQLQQKCAGFEIWTLKKNKTGQGAALFCTNGSRDETPAKKLVRQRIEFTDFPLKEITFYLVNGILMLPQER